VARLMRVGSIRVAEWGGEGVRRIIRSYYTLMEQVERSLIWWLSRDPLVSINSDLLEGKNGQP
jgi:hypothetical protein